MISFKNHLFPSGEKFVWGFFVKENEHDFEETLTSYFPHIPLSFTYTEQVHKNTTALVNKAGTIINTDALATQKNNLVLSVYTADCLPIILLNVSTLAFGIAHAGWKGTKQKIILELAKKLVPIKTPLLLDFLPCIKKEEYEVGEEFKAYFKQGVSLFFKEGKWTFCLQLENKDQLSQASIPYSFFPEALVEPLYKEISTFSCTDFPSYRREKLKKRMISFCFLLSPAP